MTLVPNLDTRLLSIAQSFLNPPREPTPLPVEPEPVEAEAAPVEEPVAGIPGSLNVSSSFHFMQASELEAPTFEDGAEWVEKPDEEPNGVSEEQPQVAENVTIEPVEVRIQISSLAHTCDLLANTDKLCSTD